MEVGDERSAILELQGSRLGALTLVLVSVFVFGFGPMGAMQAASPGGVLLDMQSQDAAVTQAWFGQLIDEGRVLLASHLLWDSLFLLVHAAAITILLLVPLSRWLPIRAWWCAIPVWLVAALDAAENICLARLLGDAQSSCGGALATITAAKLTLLPVVFALLAIAWLGLAWVALRAPLGSGQASSPVEFRHTS